MSAPQQPNSFRTGPDERGHFGIYGGRFVAETLMPLILELEKAYAAAKADPAFRREMDGHLKNYVGRPSPLYLAERLTAHFGGAKIYFKREDLNHTGAHKVNNVLGQIMLAKRMGKPRVIAETGAGMHGVATATLCAKFGLECVVFMGAIDVERQQPNVMRMRALGAQVRPVTGQTSYPQDLVGTVVDEVERPLLARCWRAGCWGRPITPPCSRTGASSGSTTAWPCWSSSGRPWSKSTRVRRTASAKASCQASVQAPAARSPSWARRRPLMSAGR